MLADAEVDAEEARRKREDEAVQLRKNKKEELLQKRRNHGVRCAFPVHRGCGRETFSA